jgi:K+-sensing histidine kinase KdpD
VGGKQADRQPEPVVVTIDALCAQIATLEAQVRTATAELEAARYRHDIVGHEVRTPLTVVLGVLATLQHPHLTQAERTRLEARALAHAQRLRVVIDDLMAGDAPVRTPLPRSELETVALAPLLRSACDMVVGIDAAIDADAGLRIATVPLRLRTIVANVVADATMRGGERVEVAARFVDQAIQITVAAHGPGLQGTDPEACFVPYTSGQRTGTASEPGFGLYLARILARTLGGDVTLTDAKPQGRLTSVCLPQRRSDDPPSAAGGRAPRARTAAARPIVRTQAAARR